MIVRSDAEAAAAITVARRAGRPLPTLGLLGGDLCRTLGGRGDEARLRSSEAMTFPVDLGVATFDGSPHWFVAHAIARRSWWHGRAVAAMNAQWLGAWDLGPRSHPDDGLLDITDGTLPLGDRLKARRRLATGTHLPHPALTVTRTAAADLTFTPRARPVARRGARGPGRPPRLDARARRPPHRRVARPPSPARPP